MRNIAKLIEGAQSVLQQLWEKNLHLQQSNQTLPNILPKPLAQHCRVVNLREQTVVIYADSAVWATRLRYQIPTILQAWQAQPFDITKVEIRVHLEAIEPSSAPAVVESLGVNPVVQLPPKTTTKKSRGPYPLTENAADYLRNTANATTHPRLKAVLLRLASRSQTDNGCK